MKKVIALDIGGTNLRGAIINDKYEIEKVIIRDNDCFGNKERFYSKILAIIDELYSLSPENICCFSAGLPGRVRKSGKVDDLSNVKIKDIDLVTILQEKYNLPVFIKNDAEMALLSEAFLGAGKKYDGVYFVTISTGIGGAFCYKKQLKNYGKESGHTPIFYQGEFKDFERLCSGTGIVNLAKINGLEVKCAKEFFDLLKENNQKAMKIKEEWLNLLSEQFQFINRVFMPDVFTLTGGVMKSKDLFFEELIEKNKNLNIVECQSGQYAGLIGAACLGFNNINEKEGGAL